MGLVSPGLLDCYLNAFLTTTHTLPHCCNVTANEIGIAAGRRKCAYLKVGGVSKALSLLKGASCLDLRWPISVNHIDTSFALDWKKMEASGVILQ